MTNVLRQVQPLPIDLNRAWDYFSRPENLNEITPPGLRFTVLSPLPEKVYPGLMIVYRIEIFKGFPVEWVTEITHVREPHFFVDEQRVGPFALWHHEHHFRKIEGGVEMSDIVHYKPPMGFIGRAMNGILVQPRLQEIFQYRRKKLGTLFA